MFTKSQFDLNCHTTYFFLPPLIITSTVGCSMEEGCNPTLLFFELGHIWPPPWNRCKLTNFWEWIMDKQVNLGQLMNIFIFSFRFIRGARGKFFTLFCLNNHQICECTRKLGTFKLCTKCTRFLVQTWYKKCSPSIYPIFSFLF